MKERAVCFAVSLHSAVSRVGSPSILILPAMSDSQYLSTSLVEVMISSRNEHGFIPDLSKVTLQIMFDAWWALMNERVKRPIGWNNSRHAEVWQFNIHCRIEATGNPGILCIVCHQVLGHP
jgi:hypothetical protein